jgi:hypothetical protein
MGYGRPLKKILSRSFFELVSFEQFLPAGFLRVRWI